MKWPLMSKVTVLNKGNIQSSVLHGNAIGIEHWWRACCFCDHTHASEPPKPVCAVLCVGLACFKVLQVFFTVQLSFSSFWQQDESIHHRGSTNVYP